MAPRVDSVAATSFVMQRREGTHVCPECGCTALVTDADAGGVYCSACGLELPMGSGSFQLSSRAFGDGKSTGGLTFDHLPDKNLPTDFRLGDVKGGPDEVAKFRSLRWLNHAVPQRSRQTVFKTVSLRLRPILERVNLPGDIVNRAVLDATKIVMEHGLLRVDGTYEGLALLGLMRADKECFLRVTRKQLICLVANVVPCAVYKNELVRPVKESPGAPSIELVKPIRESPGAKEWAITVPVNELKKWPDGLGFASVHFYYVPHDTNGSLTCHLTASVPIHFMRNIGGNVVKSSPPSVVDKRRNGFSLSFASDHSTYVLGRDPVIELAIKLVGDVKRPLKRACIVITNGGAFQVVKKAYHMWCTFLKEKPDPVTIEELNSINSLIPRDLISQVNERAHYFQRVCNRTNMQPLSNRVAAAVACFDVTVRPAKQLEKKYGVSESVIRAHHKQLMMHA